MQINNKIRTIKVLKASILTDVSNVNCHLELFRFS